MSYSDEDSDVCDDRKCIDQPFVMIRILVNIYYYNIYNNYNVILYRVDDI